MNYDDYDDYGEMYQEMEEEAAMMAEQEAADIEDMHMATLDADLYGSDDYISSFNYSAPKYKKPKGKKGVLNKRKRIKYLALLRNRPDREMAFLVEVKRGVECWAPYSECDLFEDTNEFDAPKWLRKRMKDSGEI